MLYPPFCDICNVGFSGKEPGHIEQSAERFVAALYRNAASANEKITVRVLGVTPAPLYRMSGRYRYRVLIKCRCNPAFRTVLSQTAKWFLNQNEHKNITLSIDINGQV